MNRSKAKSLVDGKVRSDLVGLEWPFRAVHVTIMPVVSKFGRAWKPLISLQAKHTKYRVMEDGYTVPPASYLSHNAYVTYRHPVGVDGAILVE